MILDSLKNTDRYTSLNERLTKGLNFLKSHDFSGEGPGEYKVDGDNLYYGIKAYDSMPEDELKWENHRKYIDIQCVLEGEECITVAGAASLVITKDYAPESDIEFLGDKGASSKIHLKPGVFAVLFPGEGHKPSIMCDKPVSVRKVVFKVLAD